MDDDCVNCIFPAHLRESAKIQARFLLSSPEYNIGQGDRQVKFGLAKGAGA
jgi:hypothetical protein